MKTARVKRELSRIVQQLREAAKLSQEQVASRAKIGRSTLSEIESGLRVPSLTTLFRLAEALEVDPPSLACQVYEAVTAGRPQEEAWRAAR
jgi:transcriptional regulator with XRE-family HTH domain